MIKIISIDETAKELPDEVEVIISADPRRGRKLKVRKAQLVDVARRVHPLRVWIPAPYKYKFAVRAPFMLLYANLDMFMYPDEPASDANLVLIKINDEGVLLVDTDDEEAYRRIAEELRMNSAENVEILDRVYLPYPVARQISS